MLGVGKVCYKADQFLYAVLLRAIRNNADYS